MGNWEMWLKMLQGLKVSMWVIVMIEYICIINDGIKNEDFMCILWEGERSNTTN